MLGYIVPIPLVVLILSNISLVSCTTVFDRDNNPDVCGRLHSQSITDARARCLTDPQLHHECPVTCAGLLAPEGTGSDSSLMTSGVDMNPDVSFYHFSFKDTTEKVVQFANLDGHVVVVGAIPLLPGLAQFHYDMLDHLQTVYPWTIEVIVVPMELDDEDDQDELSGSNPGVIEQAKIVPREGSKVHVLLNYDKHYHPLLQYLRMVQERRDIFHKHRANIFTISYNGDFISLHVSPTMTTIQTHVAELLEEMEREEL